MKEKVIEVKLMEVPTPKMNAWEICFDRADGIVNRNRVIREFYEFLNDPYQKEIILPGYAMMKGMVYGNKKFKDGEEILTSYIVKITKAGRMNYPSETLYQRLDNDTDVLCIKTQNTTYYVDIEEQHAYQFVMMTDWQLKKKLESTPGAYLPSKYKDTILL